MFPPVRCHSKLPTTCTDIFMLGPLLPGVGRLELWLGVWDYLFRTHLAFIFTLSCLPSFSVALSYFVLSFPVRKC